MTDLNFKLARVRSVGKECSVVVPLKNVTLLSASTAYSRTLGEQNLR